MDVFEYKPIHFNFFDPSAPSLFKRGKNQRSEYQYISCCLGECPLRDMKTCATRGGLLGATCPYGSMKRVEGPTTRAKGYSKFEQDARKKFEGVPYLGTPVKKMAFVGEYVYLPYSHMNMNTAVWGNKSSGYLHSGSDFLPKSLWTLETVESIVKFRPQALFGGEIRSYQKEEVPKFLMHLKETDFRMWESLVEKNPHLNVKQNHVGRVALLKTLKKDIHIEGSPRSEYRVTWFWDGEVLRTSSKHAYNSTWGGLSGNLEQIVLVPDSNTVVKIQSPDWILPTTRFVD